MVLTNASFLLKNSVIGNLFCPWNWSYIDLVFFFFFISEMSNGGQLVTQLEEDGSKSREENSSQNKISSSREISGKDPLSSG